MVSKHEEAGTDRRLAPRPLSRLTYKIMSLNIVILVTLAMSFFYLVQTRNNLLTGEIENFSNEAKIYSYSFALALEKDSNEEGRGLKKFFSNLDTQNDQKIYVYSPNKELLLSMGDITLSREDFSVDSKFPSIRRAISEIENIFSVNFNLPYYPGPKGVLKTSGVISEDGIDISSWSSIDGGLVLSSKVQIAYEGENLGTLVIVRRNTRLESVFSSTRMNILRFSLFSLMVSLTISLYLAGLIGHPLRKLAMAAEDFRLNKGRNVEIPDMSDRQDEIGELSHAMREMAEALRKRLTAIERFAADVSHELKNPLTSMKSAVETIPLVKNPEDRDRLIEIILNDLNRMDRLISDISQASRLDSELSRDILKPINIRQLISSLIESKLDPEDRFRNSANSQIILLGDSKAVLVRGQEGRLIQVFENLISNAQSFSPPDKKIEIHIDQNDRRVRITVDDEGPGIPEKSLDKIFERFYSQRPTSENFGLHSGLGLSITKQIVEAHGGSISAENRRNAAGDVIGARFIVNLQPATVILEKTG